MNSDLWKALAEGATLLTATRRLARHLRAAFDAHQSAAGLTVWQSPEILPFSTWLHSAWEEGLEDQAAGKEQPLLLSEAQARALWESIVAGDPAGGRELLQPSGAARLVQRAWNLCKDWRIALPANGSGDSPETAAFRRWSAAYAQQCRASNWVTAAEVPGLLAERLAAGATGPAAGALLLAGFDEFTPQQLAVIEALEQRGISVTEWAPPARQGNRSRLACLDSEQEIETAARWARALLEEGSECTIGVVAPELGALREPIRRIFSRVLAPGSLLPGSRGRPPFNISLGVPLADYPLVHAALAFLELGSGALPSENITHLLRSPFLAGFEQEAQQRSLLDGRLRAMGSPELSLETVIRAAAAERYRERPSPHHAPLLARRLTRWREAHREMRNKRQPAGAWAAAFNRLLGALGWPAGLKLDSAAHQTWEKLLELFSALSGLELVLPALRFNEALAHLRALARETQFQPEGGAAPVQILGELEAGGLDFDHLWVLGMHDEVWPRRAEPNPFLPLELQRSHDLPRSSAARELAYARRVTGRLGRAAGNVVFSTPAREGDRPLRPSPLIVGLREIQAAELTVSGAKTYGEAMIASTGLEALPDREAPPLPAGEHASGGSALFRDQAACPFRAFAAHRLHARPLAEPSQGLDAAERGNLIHKVMQKAWVRLETSAHLNGLEPARLKTLVAEVVEETLQEFATANPELMREKFRKLEQARLAGLVEEFLALEKTRRPFAVAGTEHPMSLTVAGLQVNIRSDRLDRLDDGRNVVIDYKTGDSDWKSWVGSRPDEPQLPLYCSADEIEVAAVAFARLKKGVTAFNGLEDEPGILPQVSPFSDYPLASGATSEADDNAGAVMAEWRSVLEELGAQFRAGRAGVFPKNEKTCTYCELHSLCRIGDLAGEAGGEAEEAGAEAENHG